MRLQINILTIMSKNFCIIIISHGRPNDIYTLATLQRAGCTIPIYILIDDQDSKMDEYLSKYHKMVFVFDKIKYANMVDQYDNFNNLRTTTHARNACFDLAKELGYKYFLVLDDDYTGFSLRIDNKLQHPDVVRTVNQNIDNLFLMTLDYYKNSTFTSICYSQGGDWFGGGNAFNLAPKRKAMNSFFCSIDRRFYFVSRLNEDVNTYMTLGNIGHVFMTIPFVQLNQKTTQKTAGGMTEAYKANGTYVKSFYTVIARPDCTKINLMGRTNSRLHHNIKWGHAVPCIISEKYKKGDNQEIQSRKDI